MAFLNTLRRKLAEVFALPYSAGKVNWFTAEGNKENISYYTRWIYACVNLIANNLATVNWKLYQKKGKEISEVEDHPLLNLLWKYNDRFTKFDSIKLSIIYFLLEGKSPWLILGDRKPEEIWIIPPGNLFEKLKDENGYPLTYEYKVGQNKKEIPAQSILMLRNPDPNNPLKGKSVLSAVRDIADTDNHLITWNLNLLKNDIRPPGGIEVPGALDEEQSKLLKNIFKDQFAGYEHAYEVPILVNGAKFTPYTIPPKDLEFMRGRELNRDEILAIFGVPKILLGLEGDYNRATSETAKNVFAENTLNPIMEMITEQLNEFLVPRYGDNLWLEFTPFSTEDREFNLNEIDKGFNRWLTPNEIRQRYGLPELNGGDAIRVPMMDVPAIEGEKTPEAGKGYIIMEKKPGSNLNSLKAETIRKRILARDHRKNKSAEDIADKAVQKLTGITRKILKVRQGKTTLPVYDKETKEKLWNTFIEVKRKYDNAWAETFKGIFKRQKEIIIGNLEGKKMTAKDVMFNKNEEVKATIKLIKPQYFASLEAGATLGQEFIGGEAVDITTLPAVQKWVKYISDKYAEEITNTTYDRVAGELKLGIDEGEGISQLSARVSDLFDEMTDGRANVIARTESARALTAGEAYYWDERGLEKMEWFLAGSDPCEICQANSTDDTWTVDDAKDGTVDYSHPNCECMFLPVYTNNQE